jgi:hypothetical protein
MIQELVKGISTQEAEEEDIPEIVENVVQQLVGTLGAEEKYRRKDIRIEELSRKVLRELAISTV